MIPRCSTNEKWSKSEKHRPN